MVDVMTFTWPILMHTWFGLPKILEPDQNQEIHKPGFDSEIEKFVASDDILLKFLSTLSKKYRMKIHEFGGKYNLKHYSSGEDNERYITLEKNSFVTARNYRNVASQELKEAANYNFEASDNVNAVLADERRKTPKTRWKAQKSSSTSGSI